MKNKLLLLGLIGYFLNANAQDNKIESTGDVGIGTTNPTDKLDVRGTISVGDDSGQYPFKIWSGGTGNSNHMRIGTDYGHPGDAVIELYQNYTGGNQQNPGKLIVNGNLGIGTINPTDKLDVRGAISVGDDSGQYPFKIWSGGTGNSNHMRIGTDYAHYGDAVIELYQNYTGGNQQNPGKLIVNGNLGIGTTTPGSWKLAVNGNIRAKEIKVETGWSDFVFHDNYILPTLNEVENYIKEKGHLKDIPSAEEVEENGIFLGEMDSRLLQKIEELTLYTIQQQKEIENLKKENSEVKLLKIKLLELQSRFDKLESRKKRL